MAVLVAFVLLLMLEAARRQRKEALVLESQYRLFALRDELREFAMENPVVAQNWVFQYLDSTIARSIRFMPRFSIWFILGLVLTHRNDTDLEKLRNYLKEEYNKPENRKHKDIEERLTKTLGEYIISRHILMLFISASALVLPAALARLLRQLKRQSLELVVESPETSTLQKFAPQQGLASA